LFYIFFTIVFLFVFPKTKFFHRSIPNHQNI